MADYSAPMGVSQTGTANRGVYQLKPEPEPPVKVAEPKEAKPRLSKQKSQNGTYEVTMADGKKSMKPGGGGRFAALKAKLGGRKGVDDPAALAAVIGRQKYGKARFQEMAAKGRSK